MLTDASVCKYYIRGLQNLMQNWILFGIIYFKPMSSFSTIRIYVNLYRALSWIHFRLCTQINIVLFWRFTSLKLEPFVRKRVWVSFTCGLRPEHVVLPLPPYMHGQGHGSEVEHLGRKSAFTGHAKTAGISFKLYHKAGPSIYLWIL